MKKILGLVGLLALIVPAFGFHTWFSSTAYVTDGSLAQSLTAMFPGVVGLENQISLNNGKGLYADTQLGGSVSLSPMKIHAHFYQKAYMNDQYHGAIPSGVYQKIRTSSTTGKVFSQDLLAVVQCGGATEPDKFWLEQDMWAKYQESKLWFVGDQTVRMYGDEAGLQEDTKWYHGLRTHVTSGKSYGGALNWDQHWDDFGLWPW